MDVLDISLDPVDISDYVDYNCGKKAVRMSEKAEQSGEKRIVKVTEKAMEEQKQKQINARKYKLSQLSGMIKQLEELMKNDANADVVKNKLRVDYNRLQQEFIELQRGMRKFMSEHEFADDQKTWFEPKNKCINDLFWKCEDWMKNVLAKAEQAAEQATAAAMDPVPVRAEDAGRAVPVEVRSTSSKGSRHSRRSGSQYGSVRH